MQRVFYNSSEGCPNGCLYCFANWDDSGRFGRWDGDTINENAIVYPVCNSEVADPENLLEKIKAVSSKTPKKIIFSISTKSMWHNALIEKIREINCEYQDKVLVKLSVSFSCVTDLEKIEPYASSFYDRISLLEKLVTNKIPTSVLLKPVLPFVPFEEYKFLIDECLKVCSFFVVGPLYVDRSSKFYNEYIKDKFVIERKWCEWLNSQMDYVYHDKYVEILKYINFAGKAYESDMDFILDYLGGHL